MHVCEMFAGVLFDVRVVCSGSRCRCSFALNALPRFHYSCLLPDVPRRLLKARVALFVCASAAESEAHDGWPRPALEQQHGKDDAETKAKGRFYQEVREAAVPLCSVSVSLRSILVLIFSPILVGCVFCPGVGRFKAIVPFRSREPR